MKKDILYIAVKVGLVLGGIVAASAFIHSALRHNLYASLIPLWVVYLFATVFCYLWAYSLANKKENQVNFISAILLVAIIATIAALINGLEAYAFTEFYDTNYLSEMMSEAKENWKQYNYTEASIQTQWEQTLYKDPFNHGFETFKTMFIFNSVLGSFAFVMYFIRWMLKKPKKRAKRKI